jgi:nitronate monooxygenase
MASITFRSSARPGPSALWKRAYHKVPEWLGAVVYEDPWLAGGHNGLSNAEDPTKPEDPYPRVKALRDTMRAEGIPTNCRSSWQVASGICAIGTIGSTIRNLAKSPSSIGTRPLLTQESPIPQVWKDHLTKIPEGGVLLHKFSPTGFYSSAVINPFLRELQARSDRQIPYSTEQAGDHTALLDVGVRGKNFWVTPHDLQRAREWDARGFTMALRTPDNTLVFVTPEEGAVIRKDQTDCMGCLSHCGFSSWKDHDNNSPPGGSPIRAVSASRRRLQNIAHGESIDENLMFAGHVAYEFGRDPFLFQWLRPDGEAIGRSHPDRGLTDLRFYIYQILTLFLRKRKVGEL